MPRPALVLSQGTFPHTDTTTFLSTVDAEAEDDVTRTVREIHVRRRPSFVIASADVVDRWERA